jgi:hypothetical protein
LQATNDLSAMERRVIQGDGIVAFFDLGDDEFKVEMSFDAFAPILRDWEAAWDAAKTYNANAK